MGTQGWFGDVERHWGHRGGHLGRGWGHLGDIDEQSAMSWCLVGEVAQSGDVLGTREGLGTGWGHGGTCRSAWRGR